MEILDLDALRQMASGRWRPPELEVGLRPPVYCDLCGAPVAGGIIHRFCPARGPSQPPIVALPHRRRRKPRARHAS